ncbi:MAG: ATP-binding cassette domain-containing protein, partial [Tardiphaga sp.]
MSELPHEILHLSNVSRNFSGLKALSDVSISVSRGEVLGLIGPNGAGKTTLVNTICGVTPASSGVVTFDGRDITRIKTYQAARLGLSRTFQIVQPFAEFSALDNVAMPLRIRRESVAAARAQGQAMLARVGLAARLAHHP